MYLNLRGGQHIPGTLAGGWLALGGLAGGLARETNRFDTDNEKG